MGNKLRQLVSIDTEWKNGCCRRFRCPKAGLRLCQVRTGIIIHARKRRKRKLWSKHMSLASPGYCLNTCSLIGFLARIATPSSYPPLLKCLQQQQTNLFLTAQPPQWITMTSGLALSKTLGITKTKTMLPFEPTATINPCLDSLVGFLPLG